MRWTVSAVSIAILTKSIETMRGGRAKAFGRSFHLREEEVIYNPDANIP
jgi:hypothetical protein